MRHPKLITSILFLISAWTCLAQLPVVPLQVISSAPVIQNPTNVDTIGGPFRWWVSRDMTVGITVSNQWLDRVISAHAWQMDTTKSPTNALIGVRFNGAQSLTNISFNQAAKGSVAGTVFIIFRYDANGNQFLCCEDAGRGPAIDASGNFKYWGGGVTAVIAPIPSAKYNDIAIVFSGGTQAIYYTNGFPALTNAGTGVDQNYFGNAVTTFPLTGYITEEYVSTNILTSTQVGLLHKYGTNTYTYNP